MKQQPKRESRLRIPDREPDREGKRALPQIHRHGVVLSWSARVWAYSMDGRLNRSVGLTLRGRLTEPVKKAEAFELSLDVRDHHPQREQAKEHVIGMTMAVKPALRLLLPVTRDEYDTIRLMLATRCHPQFSISLEEPRYGAGAIFSYSLDTIYDEELAPSLKALLEPKTS